jgi:hypothetical protein
MCSFVQTALHVFANTNHTNITILSVLHRLGTCLKLEVKSLRIYVRMGITRSSKRGGQAGQPNGANLQGTLRCSWNNLKYGVSKLRFSTREKISLNIIPNLGTRP